MLRDDGQAEAGEERDDEQPEGREEGELPPAKPAEPARESTVHGYPAPVVVTRWGTVARAAPPRRATYGSFRIPYAFSFEQAGRALSFVFHVSPSLHFWPPRVRGS